MTSWVSWTEESGADTTQFSRCSIRKTKLGPASLDQMAAEIATRSGPKGHNSEYLFRLAETVRVLMPRQKDDHLFELEDRVKELLALQA